MVAPDTDHQIEKPTVASAKVLLKKMGVPDKEVCVLCAVDCLHLLQPSKIENLSSLFSFL